MDQSPVEQLAAAVLNQSSEVASQALAINALGDEIGLCVGILLLAIGATAGAVLLFRDLSNSEGKQIAAIVACVMGMTIGLLVTGLCAWDLVYLRTAPKAYVVHALFGHH